MELTEVGVPYFTKLTHCELTNFPPKISRMFKIFTDLIPQFSMPIWFHDFSKQKSNVLQLRKKTRQMKTGVLQYFYVIQSAPTSFGSKRWKKVCFIAIWRILIFDPKNEKIPISPIWETCWNIQRSSISLPSVAHTTRRRNPFIDLLSISCSLLWGNWRLKRKWNPAFRLIFIEMEAYILHSQKKCRTNVIK